MKKKILFLLVIIVLITGCGTTEVENNSVKVIPSKLFKGDTKSLEPHMDMITGCVDVSYKGSKENIGLKYEIWENGKLETQKDILSRSNENKEFTVEVSISLKDIINSNRESSESMKMTTVFRTESGYHASSVPIDKFDKEYGYSQQELQNETNSPEDEEITIWGLVAGDTLSSGGEDIESTVKKAKWGLVVKLYFY